MYGYTGDQVGEGMRMIDRFNFNVSLIAAETVRLLLQLFILLGKNIHVCRGGVRQSSARGKIAFVAYTLHISGLGEQQGLYTFQAYGSNRDYSPSGLRGATGTILISGLGEQQGLYIFQA